MFKVGWGHRTFHLRVSGKIFKQENPHGWWVGGWRKGGSFRKYYHFVAPSCKLELARFSAWQRIQDGAECGNITMDTTWAFFWFPMVLYLNCHL